MDLVLKIGWEFSAVGSHPLWEFSAVRSFPRLGVFRGSDFSRPHITVKPLHTSAVRRVALRYVILFANLPSASRFGGS